MERILDGLWVVYVWVGIMLFVMSPKLEDGTVFAGKRCNSSAGMILAWPLYLQEFKLDGLRLC